MDHLEQGTVDQLAFERLTELKNSISIARSLHTDTQLGETFSSEQSPALVPEPPNTQLCESLFFPKTHIRHFLLKQKMTV